MPPGKISPEAMTTPDEAPGPRGRRNELGIVDVIRKPERILDNR